MTTTLSPLEIELLALITFKKSTLDALRNGVRVEQKGYGTISELVLLGCADRFALARAFLGTAERFRKLRPPSHRDCTSRAYYSMYHAARAICFVHHGGDDHEEHRVLPKHIPPDFPDAAAWANKLSEARLLRNQADYDPYPKPDQEFTQISRQQLKNANDFLAMAENYLRARGCVI